MQRTAALRSERPDVDVTASTLHELVLAVAGARGRSAAVVDAPSGRTLTYSELATGIRRVAAGLAARGFAGGDVFAIHAPNLPEWPVAAYGAMAAGAVVTASNPLYTADELTRQLADSGARCVLTIPPLVPATCAAAERAGCEEVLVLGAVDGATAFSDLLASSHVDEPRNVTADRLASLPYSSGTTGLPKGVMLTHRAVATNIAQMRAVIPTTADSVVLALLPMFHAMGQTLTMGTALLSGATLVTLPRFDFEAFLRAIQDYRVTHTYVVPPVMLALAGHPLVDRFDLSSLELIGCGGAPLSPQVETAVADRLGCFVAQGYGMTEASATIAVPSMGETRRGASGKLLPNVAARIVDPVSGQDLDHHEAGELWVRGPQLFSGYRGHAHATAATLDSDGWLHTGDIAHFDDAGFLYITDRLKELIKVKGYQVAPAELEALLISHPAVADAAVIGRPDARAGEVPIAFVVTNGASGEGDLVDWAAARTAAYKRIAEITVVDAIPKSPSGKILRRVLRERVGVPA